MPLIMPESHAMELAYSERPGPNSGVPLVLLHAFPLSRSMFDDVVTRIDRRTIFPDIRGFGESPDSGVEEPSLDLMADDVAALLDRLSIDRCELAGLSMGGYVTMAMLRRHPDRIASVILMDTKASSDTEEARANRHRMAEAVLSAGPRAVRPMLDALVGDTTRAERPDVVEQVTGWLDNARPEGVAWAQRAMAARPESFDTLRQAGVPGTVIVGDEDVLSTVDDAQAMADALGDAAPHVIPGAGHLTVVESPDAVAQVIGDQGIN